MWVERWFLSSNAKDIGILYLIFALFSGLLGTIFSVPMCTELFGPAFQGVEYAVSSFTISDGVYGSDYCMSVLLIDKSSLSKVRSNNKRKQSIQKRNLISVIYAATTGLVVNAAVLLGSSLFLLYILSKVISSEGADTVANLPNVIDTLNPLPVSEYVRQLLLETDQMINGIPDGYVQIAASNGNLFWTPQMYAQFYSDFCKLDEHYIFYFKPLFEKGLFLRADIDPDLFLMPYADNRISVLRLNVIRALFGNGNDNHIVNWANFPYRDYLEYIDLFKSMSYNLNVHVGNIEAQ